MTRDRPLDADAEDPGDHAGDTAYRVANGVARVARAGAYVTGGALVAEGSDTPENGESHDASRIAGWSLQDPQPNAPSPVITYPDPAPDSVPPVLGHPGAAAADHPPLAFPNLAPGFEFHVRIDTGPAAGAQQPDLSKIPGMDEMPGTDGGTPGLSMVPGASDGAVPGTGDEHLPGTAAVPGLGNGVPGLGNKIPGLGNGIPGFGNTPGIGDSPFDLPSVPAMPSVPSVPGVPSLPEFQIPKLNSGNGGSDFNLPGIHPSAAPIAAESGQDATPTNPIHPADASMSQAGNGFGPIDLGDAAAAGGTDFGPLRSESDALHVLSGFEGVGSAELSIYADVQVHLDAHAGPDGVWLNASAQAGGGVVGGIGEQIDTYGQWLGGGESAPAAPPDPESALVPGLAGQPHGIRSGIGIPGSEGPEPAHAPVVPGSGIVQSGVPGAAMPVGLAGPVVSAVPVVPATVSLSPALPTAGPVVSAVPASVAAPAAVTTPAVATAPQPAVVAVATPPVPQPVVTTPLQPAVHPDATAHVLAGALPDHLGPIPLGAAAVVGPAAFLGLPRPAPAAPATPAPGEHSGSTAPTAAQPLTGTFDHLPIPHVSIPPIPQPGSVFHTHPEKPANTAYSPTVPSHAHRPSAEPTPPGTPLNGHGTNFSGATSTIAEHPSPTFTSGTTTDSNPGATAGPSTAAHPGSDSATAPTTVLQSRGPSTPTRDSTPTHGSTPTHDSTPAYGPQPSHDSEPTRRPVPTHDWTPSHEVPAPSREPSVPTMPGHDSPPAVTAPQLPSGNGTEPGAHTAPIAPTMPQTTVSPHLPPKPVAQLHDSSAYQPWQDSGHAGLTAVPAGLSGGLLPGTGADPAHVLIHAVPDLHITL